MDTSIFNVTHIHLYTFIPTNPQTHKPVYLYTIPIPATPAGKHQ